jgi:thiosulfate/3-mercaptopyruvate sulfurtransferase
MTPLVSTAWLAEHLAEPGVVVCDCSFHLPTDKRHAATEFAMARIPGARFFDVEVIADQATDLPHMLPSPEDFARMMGERGIGSDSTVVFYDQKGLFSAARGWWMLAVFGHDRAAVLDGGLPKWRAEGRRVESGGAPEPTPAIFQAQLQPELVRSLVAMRAAVASGDSLILDARGASRFAGTVPEPRPGLRSGHMRGARNLPYTDLLAADGTLLPPEQLRRRFAAAGVDGLLPVVTSCGSGISAAVLSLALVVAGLPRGALYDGSWAEWGASPETAAETVLDPETHAP